MAGVTGSLRRDLRGLFAVGALGGLTDVELLDRCRAGRDDGAGDAFAVLVARHGPMVLGVCRALLRDGHAADDAFQATFLVLVRKADSVRVEDSLGRWLHGVACRVARHARADSYRRARREATGIDPDAGPIVDQSPEADAERADLRAVLHDELDRLPEAFRAPLVLCHLEGLTHEEAARQLALPVGTVRSRLSRGRERLRKGLIRRGAVATATGAIPALDAPAATPVPPALAEATVAAATRLAAGAGVGGALSVTALNLMKGVVLSMTLTQTKLAVVGLTASALLTVAASALLARPSAAIPGAGGPIAQDPPPAVEQTLIGPGTARPSRAVTDAADPFTSRAAMAAEPTASELEIRWKMAKERHALVKRVYENGQASAVEYLNASEPVALLQAQIASQAERLQDEVELLEVQLEARRAELQRAEAQSRRGMAELARFTRLDTQQPGSISREHLDKATADLVFDRSEIKVKNVAVREAEIRIKHAQRRLASLGQVLKKMDDDAKPAPVAPASPPPPPGR